jgi:cytochrome d ubiquinol oxidase subunit II
MTLADFWFIAITVLWTGFFLLEGFDFGVGMWHGIVGGNEPGRQAAIGTIGPLWDGNEVWLVVAGAAIFAAFPGWYATMFSGLYLAMVLLLVALIGRGVSFEFRGRVSSARARRICDLLLTIGSVVAPFLLGVALGNLLIGLPIDAGQEFTGNFLDLLQPYALYVGITFVTLSALHGATFLVLKTTGDLRARAGRVARRVAPAAAVVVLIFTIWTHIVAGKGFFPNVAEIVVVLAVFATAWLVREGRDGWAFTVTSVTMVTTVLAIFTNLYPRVMVSSTAAANSLTVANTASGSYALKVMTVVLLVFLPGVLVYQSWTYHVFRQRVRPRD